MAGGGQGAGEREREKEADLTAGGGYGSAREQRIDLCVWAILFVTRVLTERIKLSRTIATGKVVGTARVCQYIVSILFSLFLFPSPFFHNIFFSFYAICVSG